MFLDADDVLEMTAIERLIQVGASVGADLVTSQLCTFTETGVSGAVPFFVAETIDMKKLKTQTPLIPATTMNNIESIFGDFGPCAKIYSSSFLKINNILFPEEINFEDNLFIYKAYLSAMTIAVVGKPTYFYRKFRHLAGTTQSTSVTPEAIADQIQVLNYIVDLLDRDVGPFLHDLVLRKAATKLAWEAPMASPIPPHLLMNRIAIAELFRRINLERIIDQWPNERDPDDALRLRRLKIAVEA